MSLTSNVEAILQRHGYSTLPAPLENSRLAVFHYESNGTACADVLVYREINGRGETLKDEAALLVEALPRIGQQLRHQPDLLSTDAEAHVVTFLGKRVHVLVGGDGRPLRCRLFPLLVLSLTTASKGATSRDPASLPTVPANELDQYMSRQRHESPSKCPAVDAWLLHFRRSQQLLGTALLAFFLLLGFSLLLASLGWFAAGMFSFIVAALSPVSLLLGALRHFRRFEHENPSGVLIASESASMPFMSSPQGSAVQAGGHCSNTSAPDEEEEPASWTPANTASFLLDSMQSTMTACLSAYQTANWRAYASYLNSLLVNGIRLAILKHTGRITAPRTDELLDQLSATTDRGELDAWLHRLSTARRTHPLTTVEAQQAAHFVVQTLRQLYVMPAPWEAEVLRSIPRPSSRSLRAHSLAGLSLPGAVMPTNLPPQGNPLLEPDNSVGSLAPSADERITTTSAPPSATIPQQSSNLSVTGAASDPSSLHLDTGLIDKDGAATTGIKHAEATDDVE